jgi:hypothetical protein
MTRDLTIAVAFQHGQQRRQYSSNSAILKCEYRELASGDLRRRHLSDQETAIASLLRATPVAPHLPSTAEKAQSGQARRPQHRPWRNRPRGSELQAREDDMDIISLLIGILIIVVVGALCFWVIDRFARDGRLANLLKLLVVLVCLGAIIQRLLVLTY